MGTEQTFSARWSALVPPMPFANEASLAVNAGSGDDEACLQYCMRASSSSFPLNINAIVLPSPPIFWRTQNGTKKLVPGVVKKGK
jgi:hypothetical protein